MKINFSTCYLSVEDMKQLTARLLKTYKRLKFKANLDLSSTSFERVIESMTAEGTRRDLKDFITKELQHTNYLVISY